MYQFSVEYLGMAFRPLGPLRLRLGFPLGGVGGRGVGAASAPLPSDALRLIQALPLWSRSAALAAATMSKTSAAGVWGCAGAGRGVSAGRAGGGAGAGEGPSPPCAPPVLARAGGFLFS